MSDADTAFSQTDTTDGNATDIDTAESYNPWTVVNLVFEHLAHQGLHPVLGESGDPGPPARALLVALGIEPAAEGNREVMRDVRVHLAHLRALMFERGRGGGAWEWTGLRRRRWRASHSETSAPTCAASHQC